MVVGLVFNILPLADHVGLKVLGAAMVAAGLGLWALAMWSLADSWRIGIDRRTLYRMAERFGLDLGDDPEAGDKEPAEKL